MEKEFVPHELALALKELGFDEHCLASFYTYTDENFILNKYDYRGKFNINYSGEDDYIINTDKTHYISAPLYQQAFRWFREKYGYYYPIHRTTNNTNQVLYSIGPYAGDYFTYEEAELACLKNLIEIVKQQII